MMESYQNQEPQVGKNVRVHRMATIIGQVTLADDVSVWPGAVLRADMAAILIGNRTNIQDGTVIHTDTGYPVTIGEDCVIGHQVCVHGCTIGNRCLIGIGSIVLSGAEIGDECIIGAGAVVLEGKKIPPRSLVLGIPGKIIRQVTERDIRSILGGVEEYLHLREQLPQI